MRRSLVLGIVLVLVAIAGWGIYQHSYQQITLTSTNADTVVFYKSVNSDNGLRYDPQKPVLTLRAAGTYKIRRGLYQYVASSANGAYSRYTSQIRAGSQPIIFSVQLAYSPTELSTLLASEQPAALQALQQAYAFQTRGFTPASGTLYDKGEWYGVKLVPSDGSQDVYRAILKKTASGWVVATKPPAIILSQPDYPDIPTSVLEDVDSL